MDTRLLPELWLSLSTLGLLAGAGLTCWLHLLHRLDFRIEPASPPAAGPLISIIVPARNEARNLERCLTALLGQTYLNLELVVVDDGSSDATPQIAAEFARRDGRVRLLPGQPLPPGWAGKPHALAQGAALARGEWLCFMDADTFAGPHLLAASLSAAQAHTADLLTLLTGQELGSFWEKTIMPIVFTGLAVGFPAHRVNDPRRPDAIANGQFILIRREVYQAVGGHAAEPGAIVEDKALAERVKRAGFRLLLADGRGLAATRMYTGLGEIWEGWTKNIFLGLRDRLGLLAFGALVGLAGALSLPLWLAAGLAWWALGGGLPAALVVLECLLLWAAVVYARGRVAQSFGLAPWYGLTLPLGALLFTGMVFHSAARVLLGRGVVWKGRKY